MKQDEKQSRGTMQKKTPYNQKGSKPKEQARQHRQKSTPMSTFRCPKIRNFDQQKKSWASCTSLRDPAENGGIPAETVYDRGLEPIS